MPKFPYKQLGISFDRDYRNDLNQNLKDIESDIKELGQSHLTALSAADEAKKQANIAKTEAAKATVETERLKNVDAAQFDARLTEVSEQLAQEARETTTVGHGTSVVNADVGSPVNVMVSGRTLVNLLGKDGNFEKDSNGDGVADFWSSSVLNNSVASLVAIDIGKNAQRITGSSSDSGINRRLLKEVVVNPNKYYIAIINFSNDGVTVGRFNLSGFTAIDSSTSGLKCIKFNSLTNSNCSFYISNMGTLGSIGWVQFDSFRIYEIDQSTYDKIGVSLTDADVERMFPYVDSVQHLTDPIVTAEGDNLIPPFTEWTLHANAKVISPYELKLTHTGTQQSSTTDVKLLPSQTYTFTCQNNDTDSGINGEVRVFFYDNKGVYLSRVDTKNGQITFTTPNNVAYGLFGVSNASVANGSYFTFKNPMLTLGSTPKPFVPRNPSYLYADVQLGKIGDKKDVLSEDWSSGKKKWMLTKWIEKDVVLDGSLSWTGALTLSGAKRVYYTNGLSLGGIPSIFTKYDGKVLNKVSNNPTTGFDEYFSNGIMYMTISNLDSGWVETYTPIVNEIKSYFNGWKVKTSDGSGKPTAWTSVVDGTDAPTQTLAYVSANKAPNYTPYKLSYVLATPQTINVTDKVEGDLVVSGLTQVSVTSGFTYTTDPSTGKRTYTLTPDNQRYKETCNATEVLMTYAKNIRGAVDGLNAKTSDIATDVSIHAKSLIDLYVRVKALESGV